MARKGSKDRGLFERDGVWWIRYMDGTGQERRERIGAKGLARRVYEKRKTEIREGTYFPPDRRRSVLFDEILEDYRTQAQATGRAILRGESGYNRLGQVFGGKRVDTINPKDVESFRDELASQTSPATANRHLSLLRAVFRRAIRDGKVGISPFRAVAFLKENNIRVRYLTPAEEQRLLKVLPDLLRPLVIVAIHTGMRKGELLALKWNEVDFYSKTLTIRRGQGGGRAAAADERCCQRDLDGTAEATDPAGQSPRPRAVESVCVLCRAGRASAQFETGVVQSARRRKT